MAENKNYKDTPAAFISGEVREAKTSGNKYVWAKTFDLDKIKEKLGTNFVNLKMVFPKNPKTDGERTFIFTPSDRRMEEGSPNKGSQSQDDDVVV